MEQLKLIALDEDDLKVISTHLQDAVLKVADMTFLPGESRFAVLMNRFDWLSAVQDTGTSGSDYLRRRCALHFDQVRHAQFRSISLNNGDEALELLAIAFEASEAPAGFITLTFSGGGAVRLHVDCIEAALRDLGPSWKTAIKPAHPDDNQDQSMS